VTPSEEARLFEYYDGELDPEEAREVERWLAASEEAQRLLAEISEVGVAVRAAAHARSSAADAIAETVLDAIEAGDRRARPERLRDPVPGNGRGARRSRTGRLLVGLAPALGLALAAAAVALHVTPPVRSLGGEPSAAPREVRSAAPAPGGSETTAELPPSSEPETGASIESVDFGARNGTIFMVSGVTEVTPVVWLMDESSMTGDRMHAL
jgi:anti-sigma factor RsiW